MSSDRFSTYLTNISKTPLLTHKEEIRLGNIIRRSKNPANKEAARHALIEANLRLPVKLAHNFRSHTITIEELTFEGNQGLMKAAEKYKPSKGVRFSTYASHWILLYIRLAVNRSHTVRTPLRRASRLARIQSSASFNPDTDEQNLALLSAETKLTPQEIKSTLKRQAVTIPIDSPHSDKDGLTLQATLPSNEADAAAQMVSKEMQQILTTVLHKIDKQQREVLKRRFGIVPDVALGEDWAYLGQETLSGIAVTKGITHERIRQLQQKGLEAIKRMMRRQHGVESGSLDMQHSFA